MRDIGIIVFDALAMRGIVLPVVADIVHPVVVVDVEVAVAPIAAAAPVITPASDGPRGAECEAGRDDAGADVGWITEVIGRILRIGPFTVSDDGIVVRDVDRVRLRLLDDDHLLVLLPLNADLLPFVGNQFVSRLRLGAQPLYRVHHIRLLREHRIAHGLGPVELVAHHGENRRRAGERLDAVVPTLLADLGLEGVALQALVLAQPAVGLHHFQRIGRRRQHVRKQGVGIERNRRRECFELLRLQQ